MNQHLEQLEHAPPAAAASGLVALRAALMGAQRIYDDFNDASRAFALSRPVDVDRGVLALAPILAKWLHPSIVADLLRQLDGVDTDGPAPGLCIVADEVLSPRELSRRVLALEQALRGAGTWVANAI